MNTTRFIITNCSYFECNNNLMVFFDVEDTVKHVEYHLHDWLIDDTHIDRENSLIEDEQQTYLKRKELKEIYNILDNELSHLGEELTERESFLKHLLRRFK